MELKFKIDFNGQALNGANKADRPRSHLRRSFHGKRKIDNIRWSQLNE